MPVPVLYVTEPGAVVRKSAESIVVTLDEDPDGKGPLPERRRTLAEVEPHRLEAICLVGRAHVTSDAVHLCVERGVAVSWMTAGGALRGRLVPEAPRSADLRLLQYAAHAGVEGRLSRARGVAAAKARNAAAVLGDLRSNDADNPAYAPAAARLRALAQDAERAAEAASLLGYEGTAARTYFDALGAAFKGEIGFSGRAQRPAPDPANALLSFGYVLLGSRLAGLIEARGLDPALGFFHEVRPGRPSLALDLLEELRHPIVDRFVLRACNLRIFKPAMFESDPDRPGGVRMTRDGLKRFFAEWEKHLLRPLRDAEAGEPIGPLPLLVRQVDRFAADLRGGEPYRPFRFGD